MQLNYCPRYYGRVFIHTKIVHAFQIYSFSFYSPQSNNKDMLRKTILFRLKTYHHKHFVPKVNLYILYSSISTLSKVVQTTSIYVDFLHLWRKHCWYVRWQSPFLILNIFLCKIYWCRCFHKSSHKFPHKLFICQSFLIYKLIRWTV